MRLPDRRRVAGKLRRVRASVLLVQRAVSATAASGLGRFSLLRYDALNKIVRCKVLGLRQADFLRRTSKKVGDLCVRSCFRGFVAIHLISPII